MTSSEGKGGTVTSTSAQGVDSSSPSRASPVRRPLGWDLEVARRTTRMTNNVKTFLMKNFEEGERAGNKADLVLVAKTILRNEYGELTFESEEWGTGQEISGLFFTHVR